MDYYARLGFVANEGTAAPTKTSILAEEEEDPNSIVDAKRLAATLANLLRKSGGTPGRFLDIGCGYGFFTVEAIRQGFEVTALDLSSNKRKVMNEITGLEPIASSFEDYECPPGSFSAILMSQILEHVGDINQWLQKTRTILKDGGVVAIALPNFDNAFRYVFHERSPYIIPPEHLNYFNAGSLSKLLEKHGFRVEKVEWVTRIPKRIIRKKMPNPAQALVPAVNLAAKGASGLLDVARLGLMINVYGRKIS
jgi:SAM-dependent methyltransferase